jgi:Cu/Ag efflux pump CusA
VAADVEERLADAEFPLEYHAEVLQESTSQEINALRVVGFAIAVAIASFLLLQAAFNSWRLGVLVFLTLPVALIGGLLAALLVDGVTLSLGSVIAFLALLGIAARNGVMLIHHLQRLRTEEAQPFGAELVQRGARDRLAPTLTVALATAVAMLPLVIMGGVAGLEIVHPMAVVILGGLVTSTLLSLFLLPALYLRFGAGAQPEPVTETPQPPSAVEPQRPRRTERLPGRQVDVTHQRGDEGPSPAPGGSGA